MALITFEDLPSKSTALNASNLNNNFIEVLKLENPVGHIRIETTNTNPQTYLGFGTWELWGSGKVPVGVNTSDTDFNTVEKTGGEKTHTLTIDEIPSHNHRTASNLNYNPVGLSGAQVTGAVDYGASTQLYTENAGGNGAHNNLQPYITCYMWKRTA